MIIHFCKFDVLLVQAKYDKKMSTSVYPSWHLVIAAEVVLLGNAIIYKYQTKNMSQIRQINHLYSAESHI